MKKFNVIMFSDCRGCSEVNEVFDVICNSGEDVFNFIIERESEDEDWIRYVSDLNCEDVNWIEDRSKWKEIFMVEDVLEDKEFLIGMNDELREVLIISEDSEYFGMFKKNVDDRDEENVGLYFKIWEKLNGIG